MKNNIRERISWTLSDVPEDIEYLKRTRPDRTDLLAMNYKSLAEAHATDALLDWTEGLNPFAKLEMSIDVCSAYKQEVGGEQFSDYDWGRLLPIIAYLIGQEALFSRPLIIGHASAEWLNACRQIEAALQGNLGSSDKKYERFKNTLINTSFSDYMSLLENKSSNQTEVIAKCIDNYAQRKSSKTFLDMDSFEGGGEANDLFPDFRLSAVMKKIGAVSGTRHDWLWV